MKVLIITLLIIFSYSVNAQSNQKGYMMGMSIGKGSYNNAVVNVEFARQCKFIMVALDVNYMCPLNELPILVGPRLYIDIIRVNDNTFKVLPYIGTEYQVFNTDSDNKYKISRLQNKFNLTYGIRFKYHQFIITGSKSGEYKMLTFGFSTLI